MNRFGKAIVAVLVLLVIAVATIVRVGPPRTSAPALAPNPARATMPTGPAPRATILPSGLAMPVAGVDPAKLYDSFGDPRGDGTRGHGALDIMAPTGTPVLAAAAGTVEKIFESENGGHTVYVRSADRAYIYYYAHLDSYAPDLREGQAIARGAPIGTVGATGDASPDGPHLHFEIKRMAPGEAWHEGEGINPYPLLAGNGASG